MTCASLTATATPATQRFHLSPGAAFYLQASITLGFLAGSSAPTPLYAVYQAQWGFSSTMLTVAFGIYALAVLAALLVAGRLSDHVGRRPVLMAATVAQAVSMLLFASAGGLTDLLLGRVLQGLSAGAAIAAVGAGLLDVDKVRGAVANSVAPMLGTALGGVIAGVLVQYLPAPTQLVYLLLAAVFVLQGMAVFFMAETASLRPGAWASLRPQWAVPAGAREALSRAIPIIVAVWALAGFYASLGPTLLRGLVGNNAILLGGVALFTLAGSGALAVLVLRRRAPETLMRLGAGALLTGLAVVMAALALQSVLLFVVGTGVAGIGFGTGFQGALRSVVALIEPHQRAGVLSVLFVFSYLAMGLPAIAAGYGLALQGDILLTAREFGACVAGLTVVALVASMRLGRGAA